MSDSIAFDRAAEQYDETRKTEPDVLAAVVDVLVEELRPRGKALEIGVGTGMLALPLSQAGVELVGLDLSMPMMEQLIRKSGGRAPFPLARGDSTRPPFRDRSFGGAYARHVLHLIPAWRVAVSELCRVVRPGGVVIVDLGGGLGNMREVWDRLVGELGDAARPVGVDAWNRPHELDEAFETHGAVRRDLPTVMNRSTETLEKMFQETADRTYSWTWRIPDDELHRAIEAVRAWAEERYDLTTVLDPEVPLNWRAYDLP